MKLLFSILFVFALALASSAQTTTPTDEKHRVTEQAHVPSQPVAMSSELNDVLNRMDRSAAQFRSAQADFVWDQYEKVVDVHDKQSGKIYFQRKGRNDIQMMAHITEPANAQKFALYQNDKVRLYEPRIDQVTEYNTSKNKAEFESFLVLGFGGSGHDLLNSFDVRYAGSEQVDGVKAAKLELTPKNQKARGVFDKITLWIDPARGVSVRQKFDEPQSGNYRDAMYSNIRLNQNIPGDTFKLKTTSNTKTVRPQG